MSKLFSPSSLLSLQGGQGGRKSIRRKGESCIMLWGWGDLHFFVFGLVLDSWVGDKEKKYLYFCLLPSEVKEAQETKEAQ